MSNIVLSNTDYSVVGTRPVRHDGTDKVTGRAKYGGDFNMAGLLHGKVLRSPHAHARIRSIDTSKAEALEGVRAVVTGKDLPDPGDDQGLRWRRNNILAGDKALYQGHAIAAVAATSPHIAEDAIELIEIDYEVLPGVFSAREAMKDGAPLLHDDMYADIGGTKAEKPGNIASYYKLEQGDIEKGFAEADVIVEGEFTCPTVHQGYIEPHPCTVLWNEDGRVLVWCSTQGGFLVRDRTADILGIPVSQVKVMTQEIGGGFGGKTEIYIEPVAALLSKKSGQSVKIVMSRKEVFEASGPTCASYVKARLGATKDGKMVACESYLAYDAGAYPGALVICGTMCIFAAYDIPNQMSEGYDVVVNKPKSAAYRAPGAPNATFASEQLVDQLAEKLGIEPIELRLANAAKEGTRRIDGPINPQIGSMEIMEAIKTHPHYNTPLEGTNRGRGVGLGFWFNIGEPSACTISVNDDGTINLLEGSADIGGTRASIAMQAAEVLGIRAEDVNPAVVDTDSIGFTAQSDGSRTTFATGLAACGAAENVKEKMIERAALLWEVEEADIQYEKGVISSKSDSELKMTFKELAGRVREVGGPVVGNASVNPSGIGGSYAGAIADVEVDPETGKVELLRYTAFQDAGKAVHPSYVEGQMQGGAVQGIGWSLNEEYYYSDGDFTNSSFLDYRMPTSLDLPMIDTVIVECPNPGHPFGVRGVGEASIVPPIAVIANAIHKAVGVRLTSTPMNPGAVTEAIKNKNGG
jgi:CO/xanthine dehydrogenase Mo-binding subunit